MTLGSRGSPTCQGGMVMAVGAYGMIEGQLKFVVNSARMLMDVGDKLMMQGWGEGALDVCP